MCQLDQDRYLIKCYFWRCLWECFQKRSAFEFMVYWVKQTSFSDVDRHHPILRALREQENRRLKSLSLCLTMWAGPSVFFCPQCPGSQAFRFKLESTWPALQFSGLQITPQARPDLQLADGKLWASRIVCPNPYINYMYCGISIVVQWLWLQAPNAGGPGSIPDQRTRTHMLQLKVCLSQLKDLTCHNQDWRSYCHN